MAAVGAVRAQLGRMFATQSFLLSEEIWSEHTNRCLLSTLQDHLSEVIIPLVVLLIYLAYVFFWFLLSRNVCLHVTWCIELMLFSRLSLVFNFDVLGPLTCPNSVKISETMTEIHRWMGYGPVEGPLSTQDRKKQTGICIPCVEWDLNLRSPWLTCWRQYAPWTTRPVWSPYSI